MTFQPFHRYFTLARRGIVDELRCPDDNYPLTLRLGKYDEPTLFCYMCLSTTIPGMRMVDEIMAAVDEAESQMKGKSW